MAGFPSGVGLLQKGLLVLSFFLCFALTALSPAFAADAQSVELDSLSSPVGYLSALLINEVPFPGERGYISQRESKDAMLAILWVLDSRLEYIPDNYAQWEIAGVKSHDIIDIITGNGGKRQCEGFFSDAKGNFSVEPRVEDRLNYLVKIANSGGRPGVFSSLLTHAQSLARAYFNEGMPGVDRYVGLRRIDRIAVTGRAFSWMTDKECFHPGGNFVRIPDQNDGALSGNRFFTLRKEKR